MLQTFKHLAMSLMMVITLPAMAWQPSKSIDVLIAWPTGSGNDIVFRALAPQIEAKHGVKFVITNRPGAGGVIGTAQFARMPADGYHINVVSLGGLTAMDRTFPAFWDRAPYSIDSFDYVTMLATSPSALIASRDDPVNTPQALIEVLRKQPVTVADSGGAGRLALESVLVRSGASRANNGLIRVQYQGPAQILPDVGGGHVRFGVVPLSVAVGLHLDPKGPIKIVALTSRERQPNLPGVGVINEVIADFEVPTWWAIMVPKDTPKAAIDWHAKVFQEALASDTTREIWSKHFLTTDQRFTNPDAITAYVRNLDRINRPIVDVIVQDVRRQAATAK
jgi:tripartite-type tricarboxylate transporter receptor subunit TctC